MFERQAVVSPAAEAGGGKVAEQGAAADGRALLRRNFKHGAGTYGKALGVSETISKFAIDLNIKSVTWQVSGRSLLDGVGEGSSGLNTSAVGANGSP
jgi:hypothetical protein